MSNPVNDWITTALRGWAQGHPIFSWLLLHPVMFIVVLVLSLLLFGGLLGVMGRLTENLWLAILKLPLQLLRVLLKPIPSLAKIILGRSAVELATSKESQLQTILQELESVRQKETELLQKLQKLLQ